MNKLPGRLLTSQDNPDILRGEFRNDEILFETGQARANPDRIPFGRAHHPCAGGPMPDFFRLIPARVGDWTAARKDAVYDRKSLYDYMDGGAEVYLAFDFRQVFARKYAGPGGKDKEISLDIYDIAPPPRLPASLLRPRGSGRRDRAGFDFSTRTPSSPARPYFMVVTRRTRGKISTPPSSPSARPPSPPSDLPARTRRSSTSSPPKA